MTYILRRTSESNYNLEDSDGNVVTSFNPPVSAPDDILDAILDDMGVGEPQKGAFKVLFKQDWEFVDER